MFLVFQENQSACCLSVHSVPGKNVQPDIIADYRLGLSGLFSLVERRLRRRKTSQLYKVMCKFFPPPSKHYSKNPQW